MQHLEVDGGVMGRSEEENQSILWLQHSVVLGVVLLGLILVGLFIVRGRLGDQEDRFILLTSLNALGGFFLLIRCVCARRSVLPIWIMFYFFVIGYWFQFYWLVLQPDSFVLIQWSLPRLARIPVYMVKAYWITTLAFLVVCVTSWIVMTPMLPQHDRSSVGMRYRISNPRGVLTILAVFVPIVIILTTLVMARTGIAVMGSESIYLPFRMAGIIYYMHSSIVPALIAEFFWLGDRFGGSAYVRYAVGLAIMQGMSGMVVRASRGALLSPFLIIFLTLLVDRRITWIRIRRFLLVLMITVLIFPFVTVYRYARAGGSATIDFQSVTTGALEASRDAGSWMGVFGDTLVTLAFRFNGMSALLPIASSDLVPLWGQAKPIVFVGDGLTRFFTTDILGYSPEAQHSSAPTFLGWLYMLGGNFGVAAGVFLLESLTMICWWGFDRLRLGCTPVAKAAFLIVFIGLLTEGTFDRIGLQVAALVGAIAACEGVLWVGKWMKGFTKLLREQTEIGAN